MQTVRDLINGSFRLIGTIASGETATAAEMSDALSALNGILSQWYLEGIVLTKIFKQQFPIVPNQQSYKMGLGGDIDTDLPISISSLKLNDTQDLVSMSQDDWNALPDPLLTDTIPTSFLKVESLDFITFNLFPVPTDLGNSVTIYSLRNLYKYLSINDTLDLPIGYDQALKYILAVNLYPEYGKQYDQVVFDRAIEYKAQVWRSRTQPVYAKSDAFGLVGKKHFNILTGDS